MGLRQGEELRHLPWRSTPSSTTAPGLWGSRCQKKRTRGGAVLRFPGGREGPGPGPGPPWWWSCPSFPHGQDRAREEAAEGLAQAQEGLPGVLHLQGGGARLVGQDQACPRARASGMKCRPWVVRPGRAAKRLPGVAAPLCQTRSRTGPPPGWSRPPTARATHSGVSSLTCVPCTTSSPPFSIGGRPAQAKSPAAISRKMGAATWLPWIRVLGWWTATTTVNRGRSAGTNPANQAVNTSWE